MGASQFQDFLQNTNFDSSTACLNSYADMLSYLGEQRGLDALLVVNNRNALRVWAYAYDLDADTVIFSYYLATDPRSFPSVVPPAIAQSDAEGEGEEEEESSRAFYAMFASRRNDRIEAIQVGIGRQLSTSPASTDLSSEQAR